MDLYSLDVNIRVNKVNMFVKISIEINVYTQFIIRDKKKFIAEYV